MLKKSERTKLAESAIEVLKTGIYSKNKLKIDQAFEIIDNDTFSWIDLDSLFMKWQELCEDADDIINKEYEYQRR